LETAPYPHRQHNSNTDAAMVDLRRTPAASNHSLVSPLKGLGLNDQLRPQRFRAGLELFTAQYRTQLRLAPLSQKRRYLQIIGIILYIHAARDGFDCRHLLATRAGFRYPRSLFRRLRVAHDT